MPDTEFEAHELHALIRSLELVRGTSFYFVVIEDFSECELVLRRIGESLKTRRIRLIRVRSRTNNLLDTLRSEAPFESHEVVIVLGLEHVIRDAADVHNPIIRNLNAARDSFRPVIDVPIVFVVPTHVLAAIASGAPDFFSTRSGVYTIGAEEQAFGIGVSLSELLSDLEGQDLTDTERQRRIEDLRESVRQLRHRPTSLAYYLAAGDAAETLARANEREAAREIALEALAAADDYPHQALRFLDILTRLDLLDDRIESARAWLDRAMLLATDDGDPALLLSLQELSAILRWRTGDLAGAEEALQRSVAAAERDNNLSALAIGLRNLGIVHLERRDFMSAVDILRRALATAQRVGDHALMADIASTTSRALHRAGFAVEAEELLRQSLATLERIHDPARLALAYGELGQILLSQRRLGEAEAALRRAMNLADHARVAPSHRIPYLFGLSDVAIAQGDDDAALEHLRTARTLVQRGRQIEASDARAVLDAAENVIDRASREIEATKAQKR